MRNMAAGKPFLHCAHFLAHQHIPHTPNYEKLLDLVVQCGGHDLKNFVEITGRNALHTSHVAVVEFIDTLGTWVEESLLKCLRQTSSFSIMADKSTDIAPMEQMSVFCHWKESGHPKQHFKAIVHLKQANTESIYLALIECLKDKGLQLNNVVGMGFDGASTFSRKKTGVQTRINKVAPHALFLHCHFHLLQLQGCSKHSKSGGALYCNPP